MANKHVGPEALRFSVRVDGEVVAAFAHQSAATSWADMVFENGKTVGPVARNVRVMDHLRDTWVYDAINPEPVS